MNGHDRRGSMLGGLLLAAMVLVLSGCYEAADVTAHSPGEYKGREDPLQNAGSERGEVRRKRFQMVQTDR